MDLIERLSSKDLIKPPTYIRGGTMYMTIMGSEAYGVSTGSSDKDIYGFAMPPKDMVFPHLAGHIEGFGRQKQKFEQYQQHHVIEKDTRNEYDLNIYNIVKYFDLCMNNNPNMIDSLFTDVTCVVKSTKISDHVRDNRKQFLHKGSWHKFKGYAYSQMHLMKIKQPDVGSKRYESVQEHGYDVKFAYHVVRLLSEVEQILVEGDLDLRKNNEQLKAIRRGEWSMEQIEQHFRDKEKSLEEAYLTSKLPHSPNEENIKKILLECLEEYYGSLEGIIETQDHYKTICKQIQKLVEKV